MKALILLACALFLAFMAIETAGLPHAYAAIAAGGSLLLSLK
jgi:hypothetical protein